MISSSARHLSAQVLASRSGERHRERRSRAIRFGPRLEHLEGRTLLSVDVWTGASAARGGNDNWSNGGNWSLGAPPGTSDTADFTSAQYGAAYVNASVTIASLTIDNTWGGNINVANPLTITSNFSMASGTFGGNGAMSITGPGNQWSAGTIYVGNGGLTLTSGSLLGLTNPQSIILEGGGMFADDGTIDQYGTGDLLLYSPDNATTTLAIAAGATYDFRNNNEIAVYGSPGLITNAGIIYKTAGTGTSTIYGDPLVNTGTINVGTGTLALATTTTATGGIYNVGPGAFLDLTGDSNNTFTLSGTFTGSGSGTVLLDNGDLAIGPNGATLNIPASLGFQWSGGAIGVPVNTTATYNGTLTQLSSSNVDLYGGGTLVLVGTVDQTGTGSLKIDGTNSVATTLTIPSGSTYDFANDAGISQGDGTGGVVNNAGTIEKTGGLQTSYITTVLNSSKAITVDTGTLALQTAGGTNTGGTFTVAGGALLDLTGGNTVGYTGTYTGSGSGEVMLSSGTLEVVGGTNGATFSFPNGLFRWNGGTIDTNNSNLTIAAGKSIEITSMGGVHLTGGGTLQVSGTVNDTGAGNIYVDNGTTLWIAAGGTFDLQTDAGIIQGANAGGLVRNAGVLEKTVGTSISTISTQLNNPGTVSVTTGTLDITGPISQVNGTTLEVGSWSVTGAPKVAAELQFATPTDLAAIGLGASVTLTGPNSTFANLAEITSNQGIFSLYSQQGFSTVGSFSNTGMITLGSGDVLHVAGNFIQSSTGELQVKIAGTAASGAYGQLAVTGSAALAGTFAATVTITPTVGDVYTIATYASETGTFSTYSGLTLAGGLGLTPAYGAKKFTLTVVNSSSSASPSVIGTPALLEPSDPVSAWTVVASIPVSAPVVSEPPAVTTSAPVPQSAATSTTASTSSLIATTGPHSKRSATGHPGHARVFHFKAHGRAGAGSQARMRAEAAGLIRSPLSRIAGGVDRRP